MIFSGDSYPILSSPLFPFSLPPLPLLPHSLFLSPPHPLQTLLFVLHLPCVHLFLAVTFLPLLPPTVNLNLNLNPLFFHPLLSSFTLPSSSSTLSLLILFPLSIPFLPRSLLLFPLPSLIPCSSPFPPPLSSPIHGASPYHPVVCLSNQLSSLYLRLQFSFLLFSFYLSARTLFFPHILPDFLLLFL